MASQKRVQWAELKAGIVATIAMLIVATLIFLLTGQSGFLQGEFSLRTYMEDSAGMADNAQVRLNGILVGHIKKVALSGSHDPKRTVEVRMTIQQRFLSQIPDDSKAAISASNLLGDKYINITKGTHSQHVQPDGEIASLQTQDIPEILAQASGLLGQFQTILGRVDGLLAVVDSGQGNLGKLIKDDSLYDRLNATAGEVEQLVRDVKNSDGTISHLLYDDGLYNDIRRPIQRLDDMLAQVQKAKGSAGKLLYDPALYDEARASITDAKKMLDELNAGKGTAGKILKDDELYQKVTLIAQNLNTAIDKINAGQGTIGQLMVNPQLYDSMTGFTRELNGLLADMHKNPKKFLSIKLALF
ncbi:MAG TPA: MlaD family protein [Bryobacteraceae bacterium]|nr:MlaD family protein [Bryobacteraceae bacterium]